MWRVIIFTSEGIMRMSPQYELYGDAYRHAITERLLGSDVHVVRTFAEDGGENLAQD